MLTRLAIIALCMSASLMGGCGVFGGLKRPTAEVASVSVIDRSDEAVRVEVLLNVQNPNDVALPLLKCDYTVSIDGVGSFSFEDTPNRTLPAKRRDANLGPAVQTLTLPAAIATSGRDVTGADYRVHGSITYEPPGEIRKLFTEAHVPLPSTSFSGDGRVGAAAAKAQ